ncbi:MAG TPA: hypothetical protein DEQ09_13245 [Bacteroidales bacterium]|nr:hypothetical protein [Bacteroidales bacterium]
MKRFLIILPAVVLFAGLAAQDVKQQVISSAGGYDLSGDNNMSLSWTLGELVISNAESPGGELVLTQGFQQSKILVQGIEINPVLDLEVMIYPNPARETFNIKFSEPTGSETKIFLSGPDSRLINTDIIKPGVLIKEIQMQKYPAGMYFLKIKNGNKQNVYKIVKL